MTPGDRTPAAGPARLAERDLDAIADRWLRGLDGGIGHPDVRALVAEVRAAWAENARDRAERDEMADVLLAAKRWLPWRAEDCAWPENRANVERVLSMIERIERERAALAAPGASTESETPT